MSLNIRVESIKTIEDVKDALQKIKERLEASVFDRGEFKFFEIVFTGAQTNLKYPHKLGFTPKDILQLSITGTGVVTWNYSSFDSSTLDLTSTGACIVRAYVGRHQEGSSA